jgi:hypothetical protein
MKSKPRYFVHNESGTVCKVTAGSTVLYNQLLTVCREVDAVDYRAARRVQDRAEHLAAARGLWRPPARSLAA